MKSKYELLVEALDKRGYLNQDLVDEIVQIYGREQLSIHSVVKSLPTEEENNIELEHKLQEYSNDYNFKNLKLDLGYKIGWKECYNSITK